MATKIVGIIPVSVLCFHAILRYWFARANFLEPSPKSAHQPLTPVCANRISMISAVIYQSPTTPLAPEEQILQICWDIALGRSTLPAIGLFGFLEQIWAVNRLMLLIHLFPLWVRAKSCFEISFSKFLWDRHAFCRHISLLRGCPCLACHPFTHNTPFSVWTISINPACAAMTASIDL